MIHGIGAAYRICQPINFVMNALIMHTVYIHYIHYDLGIKFGIYNHVNILLSILSITTV